MSRKPEHVVTGLHLPGVQFWARVLVSPDRLSQVKENILRYGFVHLKRGERLEIETVCGEDKGLAIAAGTVKHFDSRGESHERGRCLVSWNEVAGDINVYSDDQDDLAAMHGPLIDALVYRDRLAVGQCWIDADRIRSIQVGDVQVHFDRPDEEKVGSIDEVDADDVKGDWRGQSDASLSDESRIKRAEAHLQVLKAKRALREAGLGPEAA